MPLHQSAPAMSIDGLINFRDLGGVPTADGRTVRPGLVFRSDSLDRLAPQAAEQLRALGVTQVIDFRSGEEVEAHGRIDESGVHWVHRPLGGAPSTVKKLFETDNRDPMVNNYEAITGEHRTVVADTIGLIAEATEPLVFHCTSGKDRTGVVAALVQRLLGVEPDVVEAEYSESSRNVAHHLAAMTAKYPDMTANIPADRLEHMAGTDPAWLAVAMQPVEDAGGPAAWLRAQVGTEKAERLIQQLQDRLLD